MQFSFFFFFLMNSPISKACLAYTILCPPEKSSQFSLLRTFHWFMLNNPFYMEQAMGSRALLWHHLYPTILCDSPKEEWGVCSEGQPVKQKVQSIPTAIAASIKWKRNLISCSFWPCLLFATYDLWMILGSSQFPLGSTKKPCTNR